MALLRAGFSIIPLGRPKNDGSWDPKSPARGVGKWEPLQREALSEARLDKIVDDSTTFGMACGYADVECIDIDTKVLETQYEKDVFLDGLFLLFKGAVADFEEKVVVVETVNGGYHVVYKAKNVSSHLDLTFTSANKLLVETRGIGQYMALYEPPLFSKGYLEMDYITNEERDALISACRSFDKKAKEEPSLSGKTKIYYAPEEGKKTPWDEYNGRHTVMEHLDGEFTEVGDTKTAVKVLRNGSDAAHSGYIFKDSGMMYLFTPNSRYPSNEALSPFMVYAYKEHNGNTTKAAKQLYKDGYGDRADKRTDIVEEYEKQVFEEKQVPFPVDVFPDPIYRYIKDKAESPSVNEEILASSVLFSISSVIGNTIRYTDGQMKMPLSLWMCIVGPTSSSKTTSYSPAISPLEQIDNKYAHEYIKAYKRYEAYQALDPQSKKNTEAIDKPIRSSFIYSESTFEGLVQGHEENRKGIAIIIDELKVFMGSMNKFNSGNSERAQHLSGWSGKNWSLNRKNASSHRINNVFENLFGTIQPRVLSSLYKGDTEDGFFERFLYCAPDIKQEAYQRPKLGLGSDDFFQDYLKNIEMGVNQTFLRYDEYGDVMPHWSMLSEEAFPVFESFFNGCRDLINSDQENMQGMLGKMQQYVSRIAAILNIMYCVTNEDEDFLLHQHGQQWTDISKQAMEGAVRITEYFIYMARKVRFGHDERQGAERTVSMMQRKNKSNSDIIQLLSKQFPDIKKSAMATMLGITAQSVSRIFKKIEQNE